MKKIAITQELIDIANELDNMKLFREANTLTRIARTVVAEEYKHEPMVYNPDDAKADVQEAHSMDFLDAMEALNKLVESGELEPRELSQIQAILSDSDDEGPDPFKEMSFDEDDEELDEEMDDEDYDMGPEKEPFDYDAMEDEEDMYGGADSRFPDLDEDDF
jgi:hypothetical protein